MSIDLILLALFFIAFLVIAVMSGRKALFLRTIDVNAIPQDRAALVKNDLFATRLSRKFIVVSRWVTTRSQPARQKIQERYGALVEKVETLEREYRVRAMLKRSSVDPQTTARIQAILDEANQLLKDEELEKAEQKYIEVISLQPTEGEAFQGLGEVYMAKKDYTHAKESLKHANKLSPRSTAILLDLADVYQLTGHQQKALEECRKSVALEPNDPKSLHALFVASIAVGNKQLAKSTLTQLAAINPDNQKLSEYREQLSGMTFH